MGSNLIKCKLLSWFYHMQMNSVPVKNLCRMVWSAPRIICPKESLGLLAEICRSEFTASFWALYLGTFRTPCVWGE